MTVCNLNALAQLHLQSWRINLQVSMPNKEQQVILNAPPGSTVQGELDTAQDLVTALLAAPPTPTPPRPSRLELSPMRQPGEQTAHVALDSASVAHQLQWSTGAQKGDKIVCSHKETTEYREERREEAAEFQLPCPSVHNPLPHSNHFLKLEGHPGAEPSTCLSSPPNPQPATTAKTDREVQWIGARHPWWPPAPILEPWLSASQLLAKHPQENEQVGLKVTYSMPCLRR